MKTKYFLILFLVFQSLIIAAQQDGTIRYIEVKGEAEIEIEPDEIKYVIGIEEYWEEEFEKKKEFKDYKTKIEKAVGTILIAYGLKIATSST